jgi:hypothetical protein
VNPTSFTEAASWWEVDEGDPEEVAIQLLNAVRDIQHRQSSILDGNVRHAREYAGYTPSALSYDPTYQIVRERTENTKNLVRSVCDTATALISKARPKPAVVTDGAEFSVQERAKQLDKFLVGAYSRQDLYAVAQMAFRDSTIFGTGAWKLIPVPGKSRVDVERVIVDDLIIDELECPNRPTPTNWYHVIRMDYRKAIRTWPDHEAAIRAARGVTPGASGWAGGRRIRANEVMVVEAHHLPDEEGEAGVRVVVCSGAVLDRQAWRHAWAPYVVLYWSPPISGFYGDGIAYRLLGRQMRINYLYRWIERCQHLMANPRVWLDAANGPVRVQLSNEIGEVVSVRGRPEFQTPQAVGQEIYSWLNDLEAKGYEEEGMSQATAANVLPKGLESAPAQREYSYKETQRFAPVSQRYENAVALEHAYKTLALCKDMADAGGEPTERWADRKLFQVIEWDEVDMDTTRYMIRVEASSLEALNPAGRMQAAIELSQTGWITPEEGRRLLGHPDLLRSDELGNSAIEDAEAVLERLLRLEPVDVDAYSELELVMDTVLAGYRRAKNTGAPRRVLDHLRNYLRALDAKLTPPPTPGAGAPPIDPVTGQPMVVPPDGGLGGGLVPGISAAAAQGLNVPFSGGGQSNEGI